MRVEDFWVLSLSGNWLFFLIFFLLCVFLDQGKICASVLQVYVF